MINMQAIAPPTWSGAVMAGRPMGARAEEGPPLMRRPSGPAGLEGMQCATVRLLPEWADHAGRGAVAGEAEADGPGHRCGDAGQYLPVWYVSTYPPGHQAGSRRENMSTVVHISRRGF